MVRIKQHMEQRWHIFWAIVGVLILACGYSYLSYVQHQKNPNDTTVPNLTQLVEGVVQITKWHKNELKHLINPDVPIEWEAPWIITDSIATYGRLWQSMLYGVTGAIIIGILMGCFPIIEGLFQWSLSLLAKIPPTSMLAVFLTMGGIMGWEQKTLFLMLITFGIVPTLTHNIYLAVKNNVHHEQIDKAYTLGASNWEIISGVVFPRIFPIIIDSVRLTIGPAMVYLIAVEYFLGNEGFGYRLRMQARLQSFNVVYDYILILGMTGLAMDYVLVFVRRWWSPWFEIKQ